MSINKYDGGRTAVDTNTGELLVIFWPPSDPGEPDTRPAYARANEPMREKDFEFHTGFFFDGPYEEKSSPWQWATAYTAGLVAAMLAMVATQLIKRPVVGRVSFDNWTPTPARPEAPRAIQLLEADGKNLLWTGEDQVRRINAGLVARAIAATATLDEKTQRVSMDFERAIKTVLAEYIS